MYILESYLFLVKVIDLECLIFCKPDDGLDVNRKQLFKWILLENVDDNLNIDELFQLPQRFICTISTLYYLVKVRFKESTKSYNMIQRCNYRNVY